MTRSLRGRPRRRPVSVRPAAPCVALLALVASFLWLPGTSSPVPEAAANPGPSVGSRPFLGVLQWQGYVRQHLWRMEWHPLARLSGDQWIPLPREARPPVDTVFAAGGAGSFLVDSWIWARRDCDSLLVGLGTWNPGRVPAGLALDDPLVGTTDRSWPLWGLSDPAVVWHGPGRPERLGLALSGLTAAARARLRRMLPPGLEEDPEAIWIREGLRLADPIQDGSLELVGGFRGAVRLRGGGVSSPAVAHFWVSRSDSARVFRYLFLDLPQGGVARLSRRVVAVLKTPQGEGPLVLFRETTGGGSRYVLRGLGDDGRFHPVLTTRWEGCSR